MLLFFAKALIFFSKEYIIFIITLGGIALKRIACFILSFILIIGSFTISFATINEENFWQNGYSDIINITNVSKDTRFVLVDTDYDEVPELFCGDNNFVTAFTFKNGSVTKLYETYNVPIEYIGNIKTFYNPASSITEFAGQIEENGDVVSYKLNFSTESVSLNTIEEQAAQAYFKSVSLVPLTISVLDEEEIKSAEEKSSAITDFIGRHTLFAALSDDTESFNYNKREEIKNQVAKGAFLCFDKISYIRDTNIFVQFYQISENSKLIIPENKMFACLSESEDGTVKIFKSEKEIDLEFLSGLLSTDYIASNIFVDYGKVGSFLSFDEHMSYLNNLVSESGSIANENGKKEILDYVEYAVNKSSRTKLKSKKNVCTVDSYAVSMISEYALSCMEKMSSVCESNGICENPDLISVPELVCSDIDLSQPVRIEFKAGVAESLAGVSGLKIMLDNSHGLYLSTENILALENSVDSFCIEITHKPGKISVTFADRNNNIISKLKTPVSFILPAENRFSSVTRTTKSGTKIIGGVYDALNKAVQFKTSVSGTYEVVKGDFTINDINNISDKSQEAVYFTVSTGALSLENNKFRPNSALSKNEFIKALITLFYEINPNATSSFEDVSKEHEYYQYIASAEELGLISSGEDAKFNGDDAVSREDLISLCGRTLVKSGKYSYPEKEDEKLPYNDKGRISSAARADVAVALDAGIIEETKYFSPQKKLSKKDCAEILYNTYMAMFDAPTVTTSSNIQKKPAVETEKKTDWELYAALIILSAMVLLFIGYIIRKIVKRRRKLMALNKDKASDDKNSEQD